MLRLFLFFILVSCSSSNQNVLAPDNGFGFVEKYDVEIEPKQEPQTVNDIRDFYEFGYFGDILKVLELRNLDAGELANYDMQVNKFFEVVNNGSSKEFELTKSGLTINIAIINSFEILEAEMFCRQYTQVINLKVTQISLSGVACRVDHGWSVLKKIN